MIDRRLLDRFRTWIGDAERILLVTHQQADGDAIGSVLALRHALARTGKQVSCVSRDPIPAVFRFLPGTQMFTTDFFVGDYDLVVTLDCGDARRTGFQNRLDHFAQTKRRLVNIDQHPKNDLHRLANLNLINYDVAATAQIVHHIFETFHWVIDHDIATCLLCGLHTDTGGFKHPNTTPEVLKVASHLLAHGARLREINRNLTNARSVAALRLWGVALNRLQCHHELGIVSSFITLDDLRRCDASHEDAAGIINLIKAIPDTKVAILFAEQIDGTIRASLRSEAHGVDVARLASFFGGGGMKKAGGFSINGQIQQSATSWSVVN